jgi:molybdopterin-dependent oxidoreductase iron-sulfur protein
VATVRVVWAHDCPDMCSLLARVENGRVVKIEGDPDQPFTAGFACAKVNRDPELGLINDQAMALLRHDPRGSARASRGRPTPRSLG